MRNLMIAIFALAGAAGGCGKDSQSPGQGSGDPLSEAQVLFNTKCARCHGIDGGGNGPKASGFHPRPRNYTDPAWQASVTDEQIKDVILRGGRNTGKSPAMPSSPTLRQRPEVLDGLVKLIRSFGKRPARDGRT